MAPDCGANRKTRWFSGVLPAILSVPLGLPTSDGCGKDLSPLSSVFGENRNVLCEKELERSELMLGPRLRGLDVLGLKLGAGVQPGGVKEGCDGVIENGRVVPNEGFEGIDGAGLGALNDGADGIDGAGLGTLNDGMDGIDGADLGTLNDWLGRLVLADHPESRESELCVLDMRSNGVGLRPAACPMTDGLPNPRLSPSDRSRPCSRLLAIGEINTAAMTAATAARDWVFLFVNILLLLSELPVMAAGNRHPEAEDR